MAFYRSELEVPVNKSGSKLRGVNHPGESTKTQFGALNPSLDNWCEKVKFQLHNNIDTSNNIRDTLLHNDSTPPSFTKFSASDINCFSALDIFKQLQSQIAKGSDGNMHFTAKFDVKTVNSDSVKVFVKEGSVIISIEQQDISNDRLSSSREYTRQFNLPSNIVIDTITCTISSDNILCLDGVLECTSNISRPTSISSLNNSSPLAASSSVFAPFNDVDHKYRINITVGSGYDPQDINIKTRDNKLFINARHEEKSETRTNCREFSKEITLPDRVDSLSLSAIFNSGILYLEAPYVDE